MDPLGAARLTELEAQQAFENGVRGSRAAAYHGVTPYSDGIGLPAARDAARAAHGTVELYTREDGRGRVHTVFRLRVPAWLDSASPVSVAHPLSECGLSECDGRRGQADEWRGNHRASSSSIAKSSIASRTRTRRACSPGAEAPKQQQQKQQQQKQQQAEAPKQQQTTTTTNPTCILVDDHKGSDSTHYTLHTTHYTLHTLPQLHPVHAAHAWRCCVACTMVQLVLAVLSPSVVPDDVAGGRAQSSHLPWSLMTWQEAGLSPLTIPGP